MRQLILCMVVAMAFFPLCAASQTTSGCNQLFISEYLDGSNHDDLIEIFNPGNSSIDLNGYAMNLYSNGDTSPVVINLYGNILPKGNFIITHPEASGNLLAMADLVHEELVFDGNDAISLRQGNGPSLDLFGEIGVNPGSGGWTLLPQGNTANVDLRRKYTVRIGTNDWNLSRTQWIEFIPDSTSNVNKHQNVCECAFGAAEDLFWYSRDAVYNWQAQPDVYVFRSQQPYPSVGFNPSIVDSVRFDPATNKQWNIVYFNLNSPDSLRTGIIEDLRVDSIFVREFPVLTQFPSQDRTFQRYGFTNDLINIVFSTPRPSQTTLNDLQTRYELVLVHEPDYLLPLGTGNSWTYVFQIAPSACESRTSIELAARIFENEQATIAMAEPWVEPAKSSSSAAAPPPSNDPYYPYNWHINNTGQCLGMGPAGMGLAAADCDIEEAWNAGLTGMGKRIAVIDKGIYETGHPDISPQYVDGYDFIDNDNDVSSSSGPTIAHGQACAGLIAAVGNNNMGTIGVAYDAQVTPVITWFGSSSLAFQYACSLNVDVISCSFGWYGYSGPIANDINLCHTLGRNGKGIPIVCAAGNEGFNNDVLSNKTFPGTLDDVIGVVASDPDDQRKTQAAWGGSWASNYGSDFDVASPGTHYVTTDLIGIGGYANISNNCTGQTNLANGYTYFNGTSGATPIAAGVCALIMQADPNFTADQVQDILQSTADKVGGYNYSAAGPGKSVEMGYGRVNAFDAATLALATSTASPKYPKIPPLLSYPNPATNQVTLLLPPVTSKSLSLILVSTKGEVLQSKSQKIRANVSQEIELDTSELDNGMYFVHLTLDNGITFSGKIAVRK